VTLENKECPRKVKLAIACGDHKALHNMARSGGVKAAITKMIKKMHQEELFQDAKMHAEENRIAWDDNYSS